MTENHPLKNLIELYGPPMHTYTRAQALKDGDLIAVDSGLASNAGFTVPVALTSAAWADCVAWDDRDNERKASALQDQQGRLWDVLFLAGMAARNGGGGAQQFTLARVPRDGDELEPQDTRLIVAVDGGDDGEPVVTIMRPEDR
jgi:hypothetical protein